MFSDDSDTVSNIQSSLKSMTVMEADLIVPPILERAIPSLEALVEVIKFVTTIMHQLTPVSRPKEPLPLSRHLGLSR